MKIGCYRIRSREDWVIDGSTLKGKLNLENEGLKKEEKVKRGEIKEKEEREKRERRREMRDRESERCTRLKETGGSYLVKKCKLGQ